MREAVEHQDAIARIGDLVRGRLDATSRAEVQAHLEQCQDCRRLSETYVVLAESFGARHDAAPDAHPSSTEIVNLAVTPEKLSADERADLETHVEQCPACAVELEATREAESEFAAVADVPRADPTAVETAWRHPAVGIAVAASVLLVALAYPVWIGLVEKPRMERELRERIERLETGREGASPLDWSGPVELTLLQPPLRGASDEIPTIGLVADQPLVPLAIVPAFGEELEASTAIRFTVHAGTGPAIWSEESTRGDVDRYAQSAGVITFLVPAERMPEGEYRLKVSVAGDGRVLFEVPFRVARATAD